MGVDSGAAIWATVFYAFPIAILVPGIPKVYTFIYQNSFTFCTARDALKSRRSRLEIRREKVWYDEYRLRQKIQFCFLQYHVQLKYSPQLTAF
jgi:hypothetical protein